MHTLIFSKESREKTQELIAILRKRKLEAQREGTMLKLDPHFIPSELSFNHTSMF